MSATMELDAVQRIFRALDSKWFIRANSEDELVIAICMFSRIAQLFLEEYARKSWRVQGMYVLSTKILTLGSALQDGVQDVINNKTRCRGCSSSTQRG